MSGGDDEDSSLFFQLVDPRSLIARTKRSFAQSNQQQEQNSINRIAISADEIRQIVKEELAPIVKQLEKICENRNPSQLPERVVVEGPLPPPKPKKKYIKKKNRIEQAQPQPIAENQEPVAAVVAPPVIKEEVIEPAINEPVLDARSARKFRAQIKAGDHFLIHSHSLSH